MNYIYILILLSLTFTSYSSQTRSIPTREIADISSEIHDEISNGIVYFSFDKGNSWLNSSKGLPEKVSIGLGGITTSNNFLGVATKENGVYKYNFEAKSWENIPTEKHIIDSNLGAVSFFDSTLYLGTQFKGVFYTNDNGKNWTSLNTGLTNLTIRRF